VFFFRIVVQGRRRGALIVVCIGLVIGLFATVPGAAWGSVPQSATSGPAPVPGQAYAKFLASAEQLYDSVSQGHMESASKRLKEIELLLRELPMKTIATAEGIRALAQDVAELKRAAAALKQDELKWKNGAASLRLAADALAHPDKPIWRRYRTVLQEDLSKLEAGLKVQPAQEAVGQDVRLAFGRLTEHYGLIRTAALLREEPSKIERIDSVLRYAGRVYEAKTPDPRLLQGTIEPIRDAIGELFPDKGNASEAIVPPLGAAPPSWGWSAMMGSFIVTILTWVGWKRYKYEENTGRNTVRREEDEDAAYRLLRRWRRRK